MAEPWWDPNGDNWTEHVDWWTTPALAYAAGLRHGAQLERDREAAEADQVHRAAVKRIERVIAVADNRAAHDRNTERRSAA